MGDILNFPKNTESVLVRQGLDFILDVPDELFHAAYPSMVEEFQKSLKNGEFKELTFQRGTSKETIDEVLSSIQETRDFLSSPENPLSLDKTSYVGLVLDALEDTINMVPYRDKVKVDIEYINEKAKEPTYTNPTDAGADVYAIEDKVIAPQETALIPTGFKLAVPNGWMVSVRPRSGLSLKSGLRIANAPGTIDSGYRDEVGIIVTNTGNDYYIIHEGDRIAQLVIEQAPMISFNKVGSVTEIGENREGGFGHTGN